MLREALYPEAYSTGFFSPLFLRSPSLLYPPPSQASSAWRHRPGTVAYAESLPDRAQVELDSMMVTRAAGGYIFVKDPWSGDETLSVYAPGAAIQRWWSVLIDGYTRTVHGQRIVVATRLRLYMCPNGRPFILMPKYPREPADWPWMREIILSGVEGGLAAMDAEPPPVPEAEEQEPLELTPPTDSNSIAYAKWFGGEGITLTGKVVTAVFHETGTRDVDYFYIEEPDRTSGIRIDLTEQSEGAIVDTGDLVVVSGSVVENDPVECHIDADSVRVVGIAPIPKPVGLIQRSAAGGEFGFQPALYADLTGDAGVGLNAVGLRVHVCGRVTHVDDREYLIDDGSRLKPTTGVNDPRGIKVIFATDPDYDVDEYIPDLTGILSAEGVEVDEQTVPIPVVRVPNHRALRVVPGQPGQSDDGQSWATPFHSVQAAINAAALLTPPAEVWVAAGAYTENITLADGVAVYGGFAGTETYREQREPAKHETVLDGGGNGRVVMAEKVGSSTCIDGFTIQNGNCEWDMGAGILCGDASPRIIGNRIINNFANDGCGGGICCYSSESECSPEIRGNVIANNACGWAGGGGICVMSASPVIVSNRIVGNKADIGGGICVYFGLPTIQGNYIVGNTATASSGDQAGGGGISWVNYPEAPPICNNVISGNGSAAPGGGIVVSGGTPVALINNTLVGNLAPEGGGVYFKVAGCTLANNIITRNSSGISRNNGNTSVTLSHNCITLNGNDDESDNYGVISPGEGDIDDDPLLAAWQYNYIHIQPHSPCIDAGDDDYAQTGCPPDIDRQTRKQGDPPHVDIGADESDGTMWRSDPVIAYVTPEGSDSNDGFSWNHAKRSVKAALDAILLTGGEVWVKKRTAQQSIAADDDTLVIPAFCYLYGGFAGGETERSARDWESNETVIDGNSQRTIVAMMCGYHVSAIDGFTLSNGVATFGSWYWPEGGGVYSMCAGPFISNNTFDSNYASGEGGGLFGVGCVGLAVSHNQFLSNSTGPNSLSPGGHGGAIALEYGTADISDNVFTGNSAFGCGGGAIQTWAVQASITCNTFTDNTAGNMVAWGQPGGPLVVAHGGAVLLRQGQVGGLSTVISHDGFTGNHILPYVVEGQEQNADQAGGAVAVIPPTEQGGNNSVTISANTFDDNASGDYGGAVSLHQIDSATVVNNLFVGNKAEGIGGGAVCALDTSPVIVNNTFVENEATNASSQATGHGGGILFWANNYSVTGLSLNNIFYENKAKNYSLESSRGNSVECYITSPEVASQADVRFCDSFSLYCNTDLYHYYLPNGPALGPGNEHQAPLFTGDWHLELPGEGIWSPIDKGHDLGDSPYDSIPTTDRDGLSRIDVDIPTVPNGHGGTVDMGCYEKQPQ